MSRRSSVARRSARLLPVAPLAVLLGCAHAPEATEVDRAKLADLKERAGGVLAQDPWGDGATTLVYLDQGWSVPETLWYYFADQGSMFMPYDMFVRLEQPDGEGRLIDPANLVRYRLLPQLATPNNPDALPVGWARHDDSVGLTCAACHTGQITWQGTAMRIDGAPAMADIFGFFRQIRDAIAATLAAGSTTRDAPDAPDAPVRRLDRIGRPENSNVTTFPRGDEPDFRDSYNADPPFAVPSDHAADHCERIAGDLAFFDAIDQRIDWTDVDRVALSDMLADDFLVVDVSRPCDRPGYLEIERVVLTGTEHPGCGGRKPTDDVMDTIFGLYTGGLFANTLLRSRE